MQNVGNMGQLKPNTKYIYEHVDGKTYAREFGSPDRVLIGETYDAKYDAELTRLKNELTGTWIPILEAAKHNPALQDALDRAKVIYELSKQEQTADHHPV